MAKLGRAWSTWRSTAVTAALVPFLAIQSGLVMKSIHLLGSDEQRRRWLPRLARLEAFSAVGLTEPLHGSDSVALEATARRDRDEYVISGHKRWIGNASFADVTRPSPRSVRGTCYRTDRGCSARQCSVAGCRTLRQPRRRC